MLFSGSCRSISLTMMYLTVCCHGQNHWKLLCQMNHLNQFYWVHSCMEFAYQCHYLNEVSEAVDEVSEAVDEVPESPLLVSLGSSSDIVAAELP